MLLLLIVRCYLLIVIVDLRGFEPLTPAMPWRCSSQLSYRPSVNAKFKVKKIKF